MTYWIVEPKYIKGDGNNSHIFENDSSISVCGSVEYEDDAMGTEYKTLKDLKKAISKSGRELCGRCSGLAHTDL